MVVFDRAISKTANRFKEWNLQLVSRATVNGNVATSTTPKGQKIFVTKLLPTDAPLLSEAAPQEPISGSSHVVPSRST